MKRTLDRLLNRQDLSRQEAGELLAALTSGSLDPALAGALLTALRAKGETSDELAGFAAAMRAAARRPPLAGDLVDIVGTGGDNSCSHNLSTGSALLAAACGLRVAKHGNRAVSSACGSADVLEALGCDLPRDGNAAAERLDRSGFTFLFAPDYHPSMAAIAPVRRALGVRTIFNMLGPLTNPAAPAFGVIGAFSALAARTIAGALAQLPISRYFVVHGAGGWDEPTPIGPFLLLDVGRGRVTEHSRDPAEYDLPRCTADQLTGGAPAHNAAALRAALTGEPGPLSDALSLGAALALEAAGRARSPREAAALARSAISDGRARATLTLIQHKTGAPHG